MELYIDTAKDSYFSLAFKEGGRIILSEKYPARYDQAEKLLPAIAGLLDKAGKEKQDIKRIYVKDKGEGFTALRIGVLTANALAYSLGLKCFNFDKKAEKSGRISFVRPKYLKEPNITC